MSTFNANKDLPGEEVRTKLVETLNSLISINRDGAEGYKKAAELLETAQYQEICRTYAEQREQFINELTLVSNKYGGVPADSQSLVGVVHDIWMNIKSMGTDDGAILRECDRGDEVAIAMYQQALKMTLPEDVHTLLQVQYSLLSGAHERIHRLGAALDQQPE